MFDTAVLDRSPADGFRPDPVGKRIARLEGRLREAEALVSAARAAQAEAISELDRLQADLASGEPDMVSYLRGVLDSGYQVAQRLLSVARCKRRDLRDDLSAGRVGLDRAYFLSRLEGVGEELYREARDSYGLSRLWRLGEAHRRLERGTEARSADDRYLSLRPLPDSSLYGLSGLLPARDGELVLAALSRRESELPCFPEVSKEARAADALASICLDHLTGSSPEPSYSRGVVVGEVFVEASLAGETRGEAGVSLPSGARVGPAALDEILCTGRVRVHLVEGGRLKASSPAAESVPPATKRYVFFRDRGACGIEGCASRYRLQVHHLRPRSEGGGHEPDNLVLVCWWHHHVAVHTLGMGIDPDSPPHRRRLIGWYHLSRGP